MIGDPNHSIKNLRRVFRDFFQNEFLHNSKWSRVILELFLS
jgi:hypothetical protein